MLEWANATRRINSLRQHAHDTCKSFGSIYELSFGIALPFHQLLKIAPEQLRVARVRIDVMALKAWRRFFDKITNYKVQLYLDASPQWRGVNLYASTYDLRVGGEVVSFFRRDC